MIFLAAFLLVGLTLLLFIASQAAKRMHWTARLLLFPWELAGLVLDVLLLNIVIASIIFFEFPHEWTFSGRIRRLEDSSPGYRQRIAWWVCEFILRPIDPRHC